ncbi:MAG: AEC family transporter [Rhodoferax sp.]
MTHPVISALLPVVLLIGLGMGAARVGWVSAGAIQDLSKLVFMVLTPALLFRTMSTVHLEQLDFRPVALYFVAALLLFFTVTWLRGRDPRAAVLGLACAFSNTVMIGIPLVGLAYGQAGLVTLFTLISVHALILLTVATVVLELLAAHAARRSNPQAPATMARTVWEALRNGVIHPVPLPILLGLAFAQTGWQLPDVVARPLQYLGQAFGPMALLLVGATLMQVRIGHHWRDALGIALLKNMALPVLVAGVGLALGLQGLHLKVMVVAAALPMGANVFLFAQRYAVAQDVVTASLAVSTALGLVSLTGVMLVVQAVL